MELGEALRHGAGTAEGNGIKLACFVHSCFLLENEEVSSEMCEGRELRCFFSLTFVCTYSACPLCLHSLVLGYVFKGSQESMLAALRAPGPLGVLRVVQVLVTTV